MKYKFTKEDLIAMEADSRFDEARINKFFSPYPLELGGIEEDNYNKQENKKVDIYEEDKGW